MIDDFIVQYESLQLSEMEFLYRMLVAAGIGFILGLEREFSKLKEKEEIFAGVRTFTIVSLFGFLAALLSFVLNEWIFAVGFFGVLLMVALAYWIEANKGQTGGTTEFAIIFTYLLGGLTFLGYLTESLAFMVILIVILSLKLKLRNIIGQLTQVEIYAFVRFVVLALLILPFLPDKDYGPFLVINPREIGWVVVLTSGIGFIGYILMKFMGPNKGILLTGILGGMVSSTVVTWTFSKKSRETPSLSSNYSMGIFAAATLMIVRVMVLIFIFKKTLLVDLFVPLAILLFTGLGVTYFFYKKQTSNERYKEALPLGEPLNIRDAIFFGALYTGILIVVSYASVKYGELGIYISSAISALTDIDAITISVSKLGGASVSVLTAQIAILLATISNTIVKIGLALWNGSYKLKRQIVFGYGLIFMAGLLGLLILNR
ncbi:MgtC/SapB family protein [Sediminicola sp. 1XM1-17]|uniref:MgtC/SapB family protein n=1 Tax=Sediminicola sp. 1XM1-17 TaxID=3127702 RepID=UPI0030779C5D